MRATKNPLKTPLTEEFGLEYPVIQFGHCKDVTVEIINAGGMAVYGAGADSPEDLEREINWLRERVGNKPFGIDLVIAASMPTTGTQEEFEAQIPEEHWAFVNRIKKKYNIPELDPAEHLEGASPWHVDARDGREHRPQRFRSLEEQRELLRVLMEMKVPLFCCAQGNPAFIVPEMHAHGVKVLGLVGLVRQARREREGNVDFVVAHGFDGGGHPGPIGTFTLIPQVVDAIKPTPVLAAGGVACGRQLAAALVLGAAGVWTGTAWLASKEHNISPMAQKMGLAARSEDTVRNSWYDTAAWRHIRTKMDDEWESRDAPPVLGRPMQKILMNDTLVSIVRNQIEEVYPAPGGQAWGMINEVKPAKQILYDWVNEAMEAFEQFGLLT